MVEQLSTRAADPTFRRSILPTAPTVVRTGLRSLGSQEAQSVISKFGIMVEQHVSDKDTAAGMLPVVVAGPNRLLDGA